MWYAARLGVSRGTSRESAMRRVTSDSSRVAGFGFGPTSTAAGAARASLLRPAGREWQRLRQGEEGCEAAHIGRGSKTRTAAAAVGAAARTRPVTTLAAMPGTVPTVLTTPHI